MLLQGKGLGRAMKVPWLGNSCASAGMASSLAGQVKCLGMPSALIRKSKCLGRTGKCPGRARQGRCLGKARHVPFQSKEMLWYLGRARQVPGQSKSSTVEVQSKCLGKASTVGKSRQLPWQGKERQMPWQGKESALERQSKCFGKER